MAGELAVGGKVADFRAESTEGEFRLAAQRGHPVVLYFYPKDNTSGCTTEGLQFRDLHKMTNMYGKKLRGIERSTFLIDPSGRLAREWRGVKVPGHAQEVLEAVRALRGATPWPPCAFHHNRLNDAQAP